MDETVDKSKEILESANRALENWDGSHGRLWEYQASHSTLTVRLYREGTDENLHVVCLGCKHIKMPNDMKSANLRAERRETVEGIDFILTDEQNHVEIRCGLMFTFRNVEPRFNIPPAEVAS